MTGPMWTTMDEVNFMRQLKEGGRIGTLMNYYRLLGVRSFDGRGMSVEPDKVRREAERLLGAALDEGSYAMDRRWMESVEAERNRRNSMRAFSQSWVADPQEIHLH